MQCDFDTIGTHARRRRYRDGAGDPRPDARPSASTTSRSASTTARCSPACWSSSDLADKSVAAPAGARQARPRSAARRSPTRCRPRPARRAEQADEVLKLAELSGDNDTHPVAARAAGRRQRDGPGRRRAPGGSAGRRARRRRAAEAASARRVDRPRARLLHRHDLSRRSWPPCRASAASAPAAATTTWPGCTRSRSCPASAPRWASTACWPRWKSWACSARRPRRPTSSSPTSTPTGCTTTCGSPPSCGPRAWRVEVYPEPKKLGQQLKYADRRGFRIALIAGQREFDAGTCQLKHLASAGARSADRRVQASATS